MGGFWLKALMAMIIGRALWPGSSHGGAGEQPMRGSHPGQSGQSILEYLLDGAAHPCLKATGLSFVPIDHEVCSQRSEEEARLINEIIESLLKQGYRHRDAKEQPLTLQNIMIVAPYNMQVNLVKRVPPQGARVGTVDRFQGQDAFDTCGQFTVTEHQLQHYRADGACEHSVLGIRSMGDDVYWSCTEQLYLADTCVS